MGLEGTNINPDGILTYLDVKSGPSTPRSFLGILAGLQPNSVWIEHSTTDFENTLKIRAEVEKRGAKVRSVLAYVGICVLGCS